MVCLKHNEDWKSWMCKVEKYSSLTSYDKETEATECRSWQMGSIYFTKSKTQATMHRCVHCNTRYYLCTGLFTHMCSCQTVMLGMHHPWLAPTERSYWCSNPKNVLTLFSCAARRLLQGCRMFCFQLLTQRQASQTW